jgi:glycosyltransferase involved in cell wall biosynthesis
MMMQNPKIKIAQVITRLDRGGAPDIYRILCNHLDPAVYDITLIMGHCECPSLKTDELLKKFKGKTIVVPSLRREINPANDIAAFARLYAIFQNHKFDIVHAHTAKAGALGRLAAGLAGGAVIVHTPHGHNFYGYFGPRASAIIVKIEKFLTLFTDRIIALTELERSDYVKFGIDDGRKITVIYQGLELEKETLDRENIFNLKSVFNIQPEDLVIGMVGRLEPVKGSMFFIEAAPLIAKRFPATKFLVAGEGSLRNEMEERARKLGISDRVIFAGWREDVPDMISIMDVVVQPSLNEAVGIALVEAQAQGVAVVATNVGGIPEAVVDGRTGILVPPSDAEALAEAVMELLSDGTKRAGMGAAGRAWVQDKFRAETMAEKTSALYMELLEKKRRNLHQGV